MNEYFASVFTCENPWNIPTAPPAPYNTIAPIIIYPDGAAGLIDRLKVSSSPGPDNISSKILINTKDISSEYLTLLYDQSLAEGRLPPDCKVGKVIPVFKDHDRSLPSNYRPISLTCIPIPIQTSKAYNFFSCGVLSCSKLLLFRPPTWLS